MAKTEGIDTQAKSDSTLATAYSNAITKLEAIPATVDALKRELKAQAEAVAEAGEARRREQDKELYDLAKERQGIENEYARQDAVRDANLKAREQALKDGEDELLGLLKVARDPEGKVPVAKVLGVAFANRVTEADKAGEGRGMGIAKAAYETQKRIDIAEGSQKLALLEQENKQLKERNAALERQVAELLAAQGQVVGQMKELGLGALQASGGLQGKAVDSLQQAAAGAAGANVRR